MVEIAEHVHSALEAAAWRLYEGWRVSCFLDFLPAVTLEGMLHSWGSAELVPQQDLSVALVVGVGADVATEAIMRLLCEKRKKHNPEACSGEGWASLPIIGPLAGSLAPSLVALLLLLLPAHDGLWGVRRRWLNVALANNVDLSSNLQSHLILLQEFLLTSLLVSYHYKKQEVWVYRRWVVSQLLSKGGMGTGMFHRHDRAVLLEAADKHPMNYNAWNYRRQTVLSILRKGEQSAEDVLLLEQEMDVTVRFFETHNGDTSAANYLFFLLERAADGSRGSDNSSLARHMWETLLLVTARELRRHCDKGHEAVWILRLALMQWALYNCPLCGWTLQDELEFISVFLEVPLSDEESLGLQVSMWADVSGSYRWTSYHAARYGLQLLKMVEAL